MRIVVLGDIHGNLEALKAVLAETERPGYDAIFHTGDLIGYGPRPNETIDLIRERGIRGVKGNFDENAAWGGESSGANSSGGDPGSAETSEAEAAYRWTVGRIGFGQRNFLKDLPFSIDTRMGERRASIFHASPVDLYTSIEETASDAFLEETAEETEADLHLFGHTHRPFHRVSNGRHFINAGSVGYPGDGDPRASFAVMDLNGGVRVEFRRVAYDVERAARDAESCGLPPGMARRLRTGR